MIERLDASPAPEQSLRAAGLHPSPWSAGRGASAVAGDGGVGCVEAFE